MRSLRHILWALSCLMLFFAPGCYAADFLFIQPPAGSPAEQRELKVATQFYGLNLRLLTATSATDTAAIDSMIERYDTVGVAVAADALPMLNQASLLRALRAKQGPSASLLILGIRPTADVTLLRPWSGDAVFGCGRQPSTGGPKVSFGRIATVTRELAGIEVPVTFDNPYYLLLAKPALAVMETRRGQQTYPLFIQTTVENINVFLACAIPLNSSPLVDGDVVGAFLRVAPEMLFVRFCSGGRGWHSLYQYANLTIDDPWLRQPYGYVDYRGLLAEMRKHNFHTTIAFIPWNYTRSEPDLVSLFRNHRERFSIAIHGDNHDHKEFTNYGSKPYEAQVADLKQSLARMQKFEALTGIQYDKVMVFPHSIAPERTLAALKTYNYWATVNSRNVPEGAADPTALSFNLRPVTLSFAGFPSLIRYSVAVPISSGLIAVNEFLGNPLLFYCHSEFFAKGIGAFDDIADEANRLNPQTRWRSLGEIVKHLYVVKQRRDLNYDVLAFSSDICIDNTTGRDALFHVRKQEFGGQTIAAVTSNGNPFEFHLSGDELTYTLPVAAGKSRCVLIKYQNDLHLGSITIAHRSVIVYLLRMGSDFRDIYFSKVPGGLAFISFYDRYRLKPAETLGFLFAVLLLSTFVVYRLRRSLMTRRPGPAPGDAVAVSGPEAAKTDTLHQ